MYQKKTPRHATPRLATLRWLHYTKCTLFLCTVTFVTKPKNKTVVVGKTAVLRCNATGIPEPDISWIKNHGGLDKRIRQLANGNLFIRDIQMSDAGQYACIATTAEDLKEIKVTLQVLGMIQTCGVTCKLFPVNGKSSRCFKVDYCRILRKMMESVT